MEAPYSVDTQQKEYPPPQDDTTETTAEKDTKNTTVFQPPKASVQVWMEAFEGQEDDEPFQRPAEEMQHHHLEEDDVENVANGTSVCRLPIISAEESAQPQAHEDHENHETVLCPAEDREQQHLHGEESTENTEKDREITEESTEGTEKATEATEETIERTEESTEGREESTEGREESTERTEESTEGREESTEGRKESTERTEEATEGTGENTERTEEPTKGREESTEGGEACTEGREESTEGREESTEGREESTEGREESTQRTEESTEKTEESPRTVSVLVPSEVKPQDADLYRYYFDNPRNGGGEVETVVIDEEKRTVCVTFKEAEDAENVSSREHVIRGQPVKVKLRVPPPTYTDKLLFQNVPEYISREHLVDFFELISSASPKEVLYGDELGVVLVTFETEPDFKEANDQCRKRKLQEKQLVVSRVPVSNCLQLENEIDITELESLTLVFEKRFHVERTSVVMDGEKLRLLLCFEDSKDLDLAMVQAKSFSINERDVHLKVFYECMGPSGGTTDPTNFEIPKPVMVDEVVDKYIIDFFCSSVAALDGFAQHLSFLHARAKIMGTSIMLECTLTPDVPQARMLARRWTTAVKQTARSYAALVDTHIMHVEDELWAEVAETVAGAGSSGSNLALAFPFDEDKTFLVVGMESAAKDLSRKISEAVTEVRRRKEEITDAGTTLRPYQLRLLQATSFFEETAKRYPGVTVQTEGLNVIFQGVLVDVLQAKTAMHDILLVELSHRVDDISERKRKLLANAEAGSYVSLKMKADGIQAGWGFNRKGELIVYALDEDDLRMAAEIIQTSVAEHDVTLRDESVRLLRSEEWQTLTQTLTTKHQGTLSISATRDGKQISITATDDIACDCRKATERFLQDNTIYSKGVSFSPARYNVLCLYMKQELLTISTDLAAQKVRITPKNAESALTLQGTEKGLLMAERKLKEVEGKIVCHQETLNKKSKLKFLVSDKNKRDMDSLERNNQCVVSWTSDISDQQESGRAEDQDTPTFVEGNAATGGVVSSEMEQSGPSQNDDISMGRHGVRETHSAIRISVVEGEIAGERKSDVIVNTTTDSLDLDNGAVSTSILKAAGSSLQAECRSKYPQGIQPGGIARTKGHNLSCKEIFHVALPHWSDGAEKVLEHVVMRCLSEANNNQHTSIAFPALGTGNLKYPRDIVARTMFRVVREFGQTMPTTSLRGVSIVVYHKDAQTIQAFRQLEALIKGVSSPAASPDASAAPNLTISPDEAPAPTRKWTLAQAPTALKAAPPTARNQATAGAIQLSVVEGEIAQQPVDVVVNTTSPKLELNNGAVSASILDAAGPSLQRECRKKYPQGINPGDLAQTKGHGLACKEVYHVTLSHWSDDAEEDLKHVMIKCLSQASNNQYTSLAFPALGTGNLNYPRDTVARAMFRVVREFEQAMPTTSLRSVRIVVYHKDAPTIQAFRQVERQSVGVYSSADGWSTAEAPPEMTCAGKRVKRNFSESAALTREEVSPERTTRHLLPSEANLFIYSTNTANVIAFLKAFEDVFAEKFTRETVLDNMIQAIEAKQMQHIEAIAQNHDAEMQVNAEEGRILLEGLEQDVFKAHHEISQYLRAMERQRVAAMIANMVQWCVLEITTTDSEQVEYPEKINHAIEAAYQAKQRTVEFTDVNNVCYVIDFDKMQEFSKDDPTDFVTVIRREKIKDADVAECQLPITWTPNCQEFNLVQLQDTSPEFLEVTRNFRRTIGNVRVTINQVARIENPLLYRQYAAKRVHMERQNEGQQNERTLWHGTAGPTTENINRHGFNRSYCGKNATAYGQGVYFAVNSKYSAERRYSPPDASGKRYMYQCKVLVGYPTRGEENMRVLPSRTKTAMYDSAADKPGNPQMFIIFNDTQAYPEYLITFS